MINPDKEEFLLYMQRIYSCTPVGDKRIKTRCMLCGDSKRDVNKQRFYILCDPEEVDEPITYICFNCGESGMVSVDMLNDIPGVTDTIIQLLKRINRNSIQSSGNRRNNKYGNQKEIKLIIPPPRKSIDTIKKIRYLNKRLGYEIPIEDYTKLKLVFCISELLKNNKIPIPNNYKSLIPLYDRDYIGFLSVKNEYLILRDITGANKYRYVKYNLFGIEKAHSFYTISNQINTISQDTIKVIAAEGPFDILSIAYNIYGGIKPDHVFMSVNNGAFLNSILFYLNKGLVGSNIEIEIYKDSDSIINYKTLKHNLRPYTKNFKVFYNAIGKDFGVSKDEFQIEREL